MALTMRKVGPEDEEVSVGIFMNTANHIGAYVKLVPNYQRYLPGTKRKC